VNAHLMARWSTEMSWCENGPTERYQRYLRRRHHAVKPGYGDCKEACTSAGFVDGLPWFRGRFICKKEEETLAVK